MSYSRWIGSVWYTFWASSPCNKRDDQLFEICSVKCFKYKELKEDIDSCILKLKEHVKESEAEYEDTDYDELKIYMKRFMKDVEEEYNKGDLT